MQLHSIETGNFKLDGGAMFGVVPKVIWNKLNQADENNLCTWSLRCLLIIEGDRKILVDTGMGNKQDQKFFSHYYPSNTVSLQDALLKLNIGVHEITDVLLTHLHFDHVGGAVENKNGILETVFPNATYWISEPQWALAQNPNKREKASFLKENIEPIKASGRLKLISIPAYLDNNKVQEIYFSENISCYVVHGHTSAMLLPKINYNGNSLVYMADLLPSVGHIPIAYVMGYDMQPLVTLNEKELFLQEAVQNNYTLFFEHDAQNECCNLQVTEKGIRVNQIFTLSQFINK